MRYLILSILILSSVICSAQKTHTFYNSIPDTIIIYPYFTDSENLNECLGTPYRDEKENIFRLPNPLKVYNSATQIEIKGNNFNIRFSPENIKRYTIIGPILATGVSLHFTVFDDSNGFEVLKGYHLIEIRLDDDFYLKIEGFDKMEFYPKGRVDRNIGIYEIIEHEK